MILTVTPNVALDITYHLERFRLGEANRVAAVSERAGGKGLNVARVLNAHSIAVRALGFCGGSTGERVRQLLEAGGIDHAFTTIASDTRRTVVIAESAGATGLWEPGPQVGPGDWTRLCEQVAASLPAAAVVVFAGSLPLGSPLDGYAQLTRIAQAAGVPAILDADGDALRHGLAARPSLIKPNAAELSALTGYTVDTIPAALAACGRIDGSDIVVSLGAKGLLAVTEQGRWLAAPREQFPGNATGAGDAAVAALASAFADNLPWPDRLRLAVAWSAAAAAAPTAGDVAPDFAAGLAVTVLRL